MIKIYGTISDITAMGQLSQTSEYGYHYTHQVKVQQTLFFLNPTTAQLAFLENALRLEQIVTASVPHSGKIETLFNHATQEKMVVDIRDPDEGIFLELYFALLLFLIGMGFLFMIH